MSALYIEHDVTLWMVEDAPVRMIYAGQRWRVSDTPTRICENIWTTPELRGSLYGWRFQATNEAGEAVVFDVYRAEHDWHVHRCYT